MAVPDLAGLTREAALAALADAGLALEVAEEPTLGTWAGVVFDQAPAAGESVPVGLAVRATVSAGVVVPDLLGRTCGEAQSEAGQYGWTVNPVRWRFAAQPDFGKVVEQEPAAGSVLPGPAEIAVHLAGPVGPCA